MQPVLHVFVNAVLQNVLSNVVEHTRHVYCLSEGLLLLPNTSTASTQWLLDW